MAWYDHPISKGLARSSNSLIGLGSGLLAGKNFAEGLSLGGQGFMQGAEADSAYVQRMQEQQKLQQQTNATVQWMRNKGFNDLVAGVENGGLDIQTAWGEALKRTQPQQADPTSGMRNYQFLISQGMDPKEAMDRAFSGGVTVNTGDMSPGLGKLSTDYGYVLDPATGEPAIDPATGLPKAAAVPGSPAWIEAQQAEEKAGQRDVQTARTANIVLDDINRARDIVMNDSIINPSVGFGSGLARNIEGSNATNLYELTQTIRGNIGFDRLQQMRDSSPTGGALGQVTEQELATLQAVLGSLAQSQSEDQFLYNLDRLETVYSEIARKASAYPNASEFGFGGGSAQSSGGSGDVVDYTDYF